MTRILIGDPSSEIRMLLSHVVTGLGLEPVLPTAPGEEPPDADAMILEAGDRACLDLAEAARRKHPGLPIVCVSIYPPTQEVDALEPVGYIVKPFALVELQHAILRALESTPAAGQMPACA